MLRSNFFITQQVTSERLSRFINKELKTFSEFRSSSLPLPEFVLLFFTQYKAKEAR